MNVDFLDLPGALNAAEARFLVVGGYAVGVHGRPRATKDLDGVTCLRVRVLGFGASLALLNVGCPSKPAPGPRPALATGSSTASVAAPSATETAASPVLIVTPRPKSKADCPAGMAFVQAGGFDLDAGSDDPCTGPPAHVHVQSFCIDVTEVSRKQFESCADLPGCGVKIPEADRAACYPGPADDPPAVCVTSEQAARYCHAFGERLPDAAEWEYAARGPRALKYPWGNEPISVKPDRTYDVAPNICTDRYQTRADPDPQGPCNVGSKDDRSPFGVLDMFGNASEWTTLTCHNPVSLSGAMGKLVLGSSFNGSVFDGLPERRIVESDSNTITGFRCAWPP